MNNEHSTESGGPQDEASSMYDLLCRYVFGEATDAESAEVEQALASSEELRAQKVELDATVALVQGAMTGEVKAAAAELSPARMDELQEAARTSAAAAGSDFEIKPAAAGPRPWYAQPAVRFAAAATVLFGVGAFLARPSEWSSLEDASEVAVSAEPPVDVAQELAAVDRSRGAVRGTAERNEQTTFDSRARRRSRSEATGAAPAPMTAPVTTTVRSKLAETGSSAPEGNVAAGFDAAVAPPGAAAQASVPQVGRPAPVELLRSIGYSGADSEPSGGIEARSDDFFLGRGEEVAEAAPAAKAREKKVSRTRDVPQAEAVKFDHLRLEVDFERDRARTQADGRPWLELGAKERPRDMFFRFWGDNPFVITRNDRLSTFAADVDTASFSLAQRTLRQGVLPQRDQIRTEEFINYAMPDLAPPTSGTFAIHGELAPSPFGGREDRWLLRVGVRAKDLPREERPPLALTFVVDTSGSMRTDNRLELVKHALRLLVDQLDGRDTLSIVGFSSTAVEVLPPTPATESDTIETALFGLQPGGGTNAEAGLKLGYAQNASSGAAPGAQRRVIFLSDGVANIGQTDQARLAQEVSVYANEGVFLNTIGVGMSNHNDVFLEQLADKGQGVCDYVGSASDARRAIVERFVSGFVTVAKDLKIQVEFEGEAVLRWRQLGYENRAVADQDFRNDAVDAGEVGAGHQVTCFYELELASGVQDSEAALAKVRLRWKSVDGSQVGAEAAEVSETENALRYRGIVAPSFRAASPGFRLGALSAQFAEMLRRSYHTRGDSLEDLSKGFANLLTDAPSKDAGTMAEALTLAKKLGLKALPAVQSSDPDADEQSAYYKALIESLGGADPAPPAEENAATPHFYEERIRQLLEGDDAKSGGH